MLDGGEPDFFAVPALDPAYDFKVVVYCTRQPARRYRGYRTSRLLAEEEELRSVSEIIRDTLRQTGRKFSIFDPGAAEQAMNELLAGRLEEAGRADRTITGRWLARAEVTVPDEVLTLMRKALDEEYEIQTRARTTTLRMAETDKLRLGWECFLDDAAKSRNAQHAVRLAENPRNIAQVLEEVLNDRRSGAENLLTLIDKIIEVEQSADILDLVVSSETVLRKTLEMMGIQLPEVAADSLLAPLDGDV
jgi:hypothetical protein